MYFVISIHSNVINNLIVSTIVLIRKTIFYSEYILLSACTALISALTVAIFTIFAFLNIPLVELSDEVRVGVRQSLQHSYI